jgi:hypothetical protein
MHSRQQLRTRLFTIGCAVLFTLLLLEVLLRAMYGILPPTLQIALRFVRVTPFTEQRLAPLPLWREDSDYQTIVAPDAQGIEQVGSLRVRFKVHTYAWWAGRVGFRSPPPTDGRVQAIALGDSHTFCFVDEKDCWVEQLSAGLGLRVANLGQPVTGSISHERIYRDFVANLPVNQPKWILWQWFGNDFNDDYGLALASGSNITPPPATDDSAMPVDPRLAEYSALYALIGALSPSNQRTSAQFVDPYAVQIDEQTVYLGRPYIPSAFDMAQPRNLEGERLSHDAVLRTAQRVMAREGRLVVLLMPAKEEVYWSHAERHIGRAALEQIAAPRLRMRAFCEAYDLTCLDLLPVLAARADQVLFHPDDIHLNPAGNQVVAHAVADFLRSLQDESK